MSVLIKGINVRRGNCWGCPCFDKEYRECNVLHKIVEIIGDGCPLIDISDHGDLAGDVADAPAIIPAERSEENE